MDSNKGIARPGFAAFAGMMMPGLGYGYAGQLRLAFGYNIAFLSAVFLVGRFVVPITPVGFWLVSLIIVTWYLGSPLSTYIYVRRNECIQASWLKMITTFLVVPIFVFTAAVGMGQFKTKAFGYDIHRVDTQNREFRRGELIFIARSEIAEGDVVAYHSQGNGPVVLGHAYKIASNTLHVKQLDNSSAPQDEAVPQYAIIGRAIKRWSPEGSLAWTEIPSQKLSVDQNRVSFLDAEELDRELNEKYQRIMAAMSSDDKIVLRDAERAWIKYRDATCMTKESASAGWIHDKTRGDLDVTCIARLTRERIDELERKNPLENR